ncbi:hypothetical protein [Rhizobium oryzicola]|uniref:Transmembrane protein n=1 Tax=Rhizobium oryzicola TaxID=1232668 RepID=A0ABT8T3P0_9HYPH|nr:hypothetical protein [Rhizobium oryzicola]MDO1585049.1 hypothetical protein [Rhizobium oryzicola]
MFRDLNGYYSRRPDPPPEQPPKRQLTPRQQKTLLWIIAFNVVTLFIAPIGGATVIEALLSSFKP